MNSQSRPALTIGLPVRNGGEMLKAAIDSLLNQTFRDFVLVISDNASEDDTQTVCERYAAADSRIRYIRQPVNLGNPGNFRFTLLQAESPYFMWAAHDDVWMQTFAERNIDVLERHPEAVASVSRVEFVSSDGTITPSTGTAAITGKAIDRVRTYLRGVGDGSRFYSVYRTEVLRRCYPEDIQVYGWDWILGALVLSEGDNLEVPEVLLRRTPQNADHYFRTLLKQLERKTIDRLFPFRRLTLSLWKYMPEPIWRACRASILRYNVIVCLRLLEYRIPVVAPIVEFLSRTEKLIRRAYRSPSSVR
jgi:glycosyltransferase involved in cell wall biosynthesis